MPKMSLTRALGFSLLLAALVASPAAAAATTPHRGCCPEVLQSAAADDIGHELTLEYGQAGEGPSRLTWFPQATQKCLAVPAGTASRVVD